MTSSLRSSTRKVWQQLFSAVTAFQLRMVGNVLFWQLQPVQNKPILSAMRPFQTHIWSVPYLALPAGRRVRRGSTGHPTHREINGFSLDWASCENISISTKFPSAAPPQLSLRSLRSFYFRDVNVANSILWPKWKHEGNAWSLETDQIKIETYPYSLSAVCKISCQLEEMPYIPSPYRC